MAVGPDLVQVAVPSLAGVTPANYRFLPHSHSVEDVALGPEGDVPFAMADWIGGALTVEEGIEYNQTPKYLSARGTDPSFPGQVLVQPVATTISVAAAQPALAAPVKQIDWVPSGGVVNTYLIGNGRYVHRLDGSNQWTRVFDAGAGNTTRDIIGANGFLELALGPTRLAQESSNGTTWATLAIYADRWAALNDQLWRALRPNLAYNTLFASSPYAWSSAYTIGDSSFDINSLTAVEQLLMIGKEDGVYGLASDGTAVPMVPELRPQADEDFASLQASVTFNGDYYFRTLTGMIAIGAGSGMKQRVGLDTLASPDLPSSSVRALCSDDRFMYALCENTSAGLQILRRSTQGFWHPWYWDATAGAAQHIAFSGALGYPAIFFSYESGGAYVTRFIRTSAFPNPLQDTNYRYDTGASFYVRFPRIGSPESEVVIDHIVAKSLQCAAGRTIQFEVSVDGGAWETFGSAITASPSTTVVPTRPVTGSFVDLRAVLTTNLATTSPVLKGFSVKGILRPKRRAIHTFQLALARAETERQGTQARGTNKLIDDLKTLRATNVFATLTDENGRVFDGVVLDVKRSTSGRAKSEPVPYTATLVVAEKITA